MAQPPFAPTDARKERPLVIVQSATARGGKVLFGSRLALHAGVRPGMTVAEARATARNLVIHETDPRGDRRKLSRLAAWAQRYSPLVGLEEGPTPLGLLIDVTGCAACFHGEDQLLVRAAAEFAQEGWRTRIAVADTIGAAWGLAHHGERNVVVPPGQTRPAVESLPTAALRLPEEALATLRQVGVEQIGQLLDLPRASLPGRFGPDVVRRLDQMFGDVAEVIVPCRTPSPVQARCSFEYPTDLRGAIHHALDQLLQRVATILRKQGRGARQLECWFYHEGAAPTRVEVRLFRTSHDLDHLRKLLQTRLEKSPLSRPVSGLCVRASLVELMSERQTDLFDEEPLRDHDLAGLIDRLVNRLGRDAVAFATLVADPQPEFAFRFEPAISEKRKQPLEVERVGPRPVLVWPEPEPIEMLAQAPEGTPLRFRRGRNECTILRAWGPERIETGWWRQRDIHRDYYIVETAAGAHWWIFHRLDDRRWFLHGCFD